jgi:membrane fusion protein (multidrug efflux system)
MHRSATFFLLLFVLALGAAPAAAQQRDAVKVRVQTVEPAPLVDKLTLPGETEPSEDVLVAAERSGPVEWLGPREGDAVKRGQTIAKVDLDVLQATLDRAQATYELAKEQAERRRTLAEKEVLSREELDRALTDLVLAEASLRQAKVEYDQGVVRSPIDGVINELYVDRGEYVDPGGPIAEVVAVDTIEINCNVPEVDVRFLEVGDKVQVTIDAYMDVQPAMFWYGEIDFIAFKADPATKTFLVRVVVENNDRLIRPGMLARCTFDRRTIEDAIVAPLFAIQDKGGERVVYIVEDGVAKARVIEPGVVTGYEVQIVSGLEPGDQLIISGQTEVEEGTQVVVQ